MKKEILRLFKGYLGEKSDSINEDALKYGLLIPSTADEEVVQNAIEMYGKDGEKWNQTFHKDFEIVKNAPIEDLIAQQMIHYITTYGFESLGMYDSDLVYIPKEKLEIPELDAEQIEFISIRPYTEQELTDKIMNLLTSGIALSEQTVKDIMVLSDFIDKDRFDEIKNREVKITLYDKYNIMPRNPDEFFKYLLFKLTGSTLKIQSTEMIERVRKSDKKLALQMIVSYLTKTPKGYEKLSSIFLRNKNLFLALKVKKCDENTSEKSSTRKELNGVINKLRKLADDNHKPLPKNVLDCLTDEKVEISDEELTKKLDDITIFREIRILNAMLYALGGNDNIVYRIRNGKSYVSTLKHERRENRFLTLVKRTEIVRKHLENRVSEKVKGKTIYIPSNVTYSAPTSEKQFSGNIPQGSYLEVPRESDMVYGIHWKNLERDGSSITYSNTFYGETNRSSTEERVDLDLKQMNKSEVFGWDASYRSSSSNILFSGDITDAKLPNGATELFYVGKNYGHGAFLVTLNMFTYNSKDVPFEFVIAKSDDFQPDIRRNYVINPNNILEKVDMVVKNTERQKIVGFIVIGDTIRFYFNDFTAGLSVSTSSRNEITMGAFDYLQAYSKTQLKLNNLLKESGAILTDKPTVTVYDTVYDELGTETKVPREVPVDIDLSVESIQKDTIINLLS